MSLVRQCMLTVKLTCWVACRAVESYGEPEPPAAADTFLSSNASSSGTNASGTCLQLPLQSWACCQNADVCSKFFVSAPAKTPALALLHAARPKAALLMLIQHLA